MAINTGMIKELRQETGAGVLDCKKALETTNGDFDQAAEYLRVKGLDAAEKKASREANDGLVNVSVDSAGRLGVIVEVNCETDFVARTADFQEFVEAIVRQVAQDPDLSDVPALLNQPFIEDENVTVGESLTQLVATLGENIVLRRFARVERDVSGLIEGYLHHGSRIGVIVSVSADKEAAAGSDGFRELIHDLALQIAATAPHYVSPEDVPDLVLEAEKAKYWAMVAEEQKPDNIKERIVSGRLDKWYKETCLLRQPFVKEESLNVSDLLAQKSAELDTPLSIDHFVRYELGSDE